MTSESPSMVLCTFVPAGLKAYPAYLRSVIDRFASVELGFHHVAGVRSHVTTYVGGEVSEEVGLPRLAVPRALVYLLMPLIYLVHLAAVFRAVRKFCRLIKDRADIFIGVNFFCAFCGILLRKAGLVRFVVYRVLDFYPLPKRGVYRWLIPVFYRIDSYCLKEADYVWFTTEGHIRGRVEAGYFDPADCSYSMIPLGVDASAIVDKPSAEADPDSLVYVGIISRTHGLDMIVDMTRHLSQKIPDLKLHIVGSGPDQQYLRQLAKTDDKLADRLIMHGYLSEDSQELKQIVSSCALGLAVYVPSEDAFMSYTEPAKVKLYLARGTPVAITDVPELARVAEDQGCGIVIPYDAKQAAEAIGAFLGDRESWSLAREKSVEFARGFKTAHLLSDVLRETFVYLDLVLPAVLSQSADKGVVEGNG